MKKDQAPESPAEQKRIAVQYGVDATTVTFTQERIVDEEQVRELEETLKQVIEQSKNKQLILDFTNIKLINSILLNF